MTGAGSVASWLFLSGLRGSRLLGGQLALAPCGVMSVRSARFDASLPGRGRAGQSPPRVPAAAAPPRPALVKAALVVVGAGLGVTTALAITAETASQLAAPGGRATFGGNITGLVGTYLALVMVLLVSRIPFVEQVLGQDGLLRWHRRLAPWPISLLIAHALLLTIGYAQASRSGAWHRGRCPDNPVS